MATLIPLAALAATAVAAVAVPAVAAANVVTNMGAVNAAPVVPAVPAGLRYSKEAGDKAGASHAFLRVGGKSVTKRYLGVGSVRSWTNLDDPNENQTIFNIPYHITGTPANVAAALRAAGLPETTVSGVLADNINSKNYQTTMSAVYTAQLALREAVSGAKKTVESYADGPLIWMASHLGNAVVAVKTPSEKHAASNGRAAVPKAAKAVKEPKAAKEPKAKSSPKKPITLLERYKEVAGKAKVLDVSRMDEKGGNIRSSARPGPSSEKAYAAGLEIISNDITRYQRAIQMIFGPTALALYATQVAEAQTQLANFLANPKKKASPKKKGSPKGSPKKPSPKKVPQLMLATPGRVTLPAVLPLPVSV